jgi:hypothetical protein
MSSKIVDISKYRKNAEGVQPTSQKDESNIADFNKRKTRWEQIFYHQDVSGVAISVMASKFTSEIRICYAKDNKKTVITLPTVKGVGLMMSLENFFHESPLK